MVDIVFEDKSYKEDLKNFTKSLTKDLDWFYDFCEKKRRVLR